MNILKTISLLSQKIKTYHVSCIIDANLKFKLCNLFLTQYYNFAPPPSKNNNVIIHEPLSLLKLSFQLVTNPSKFVP